MAADDDEPRDRSLVRALGEGFPLVLRDAPGEGLRWEAARHICTGEVVCCARPYAAIVCSGQRLVCSGCFAHIPPRKTARGAAAVLCPGCGIVSYCSRGCKDRADALPETAHSAEECRAFKKLMRADGLANDVERSECRLILRILSRRRAEIDAQRMVEDERERMLAEGRAAEAAALPLWTPAPGEQQFAEAMALVANTAAYQTQRPDIWARLHAKVGTIQKVLRGSPLLEGVDEETLLALFCKEQCNSYGIWSANSTMRGVAMYPVASFFNHSCCPNLVHHNSGTRLEIRALEPIEQGTPLCISYVELTEDTAARRADLLWNFVFTCTCPRCASNDSHEAWTRVSRFCCRKRSCVGTLGLHWPRPPSTLPPFLQCNLCGAKELPTLAETRCTCGRPSPSPHLIA